MIFSDSPAAQPAQNEPALRRRGVTVAIPAAETIRLYAADWAAFSAWCRAATLPSLPASPDTVAGYLASLVSTHRPGALARHLAAIGDRHRRHGLPSPAADPGLRAQLREARLQQPARARPAPPSSVQLQSMARRCRGDLAGLRDRALLLLAAATGLGRRGTAQTAGAEVNGLSAAALVRLDAEHVRFSEPGLILAIVSGGGQSEPRRIVVPRVATGAVWPHAATGDVCPVRAMEAWLRASDTRYGPVFRKVDRWGNVEHARLGAEAVGRIVSRCAAALRARERTGP